MPSLLVLVFAIEVAIQLVNTIGAATINNLLWTLLNYLPTQTSKDFAEQRRLQAEYLKVRRDVNATSSQDEFAKWAKLRRQHDQLLEQLEKKKASLNTVKAKFDGYVTTVRWLGTRGLQFVLPFWYAKEPMFWLPHGWFPYYAEWIISLPRAPLGSVSIASWQVACTGVIRLLSDTIAAILAFVRTSRQPTTTKGQQPMKVPAARSEEQTPGAKKDL